MHIRHCSR